MAAVPACPPLPGPEPGGCTASLGSVYALFVLFDADTAGPGESLLASLFLKIQAESILPRESAQGTEVLLDFHPSQCMR